MRIAEHQMTCYACPTQAEGILEDGRQFYFRYRWGVASLSTSHRTGHTAPDGIDGGYAEEAIGDPLDGFLTEAEALELIEDLADRTELEATP